MGRFYMCVLLSVALSATHTRNKMADRRDCFIIAGGRAALHPSMSWFCYIMNFSFFQYVWPQTEILLWLRINSTQCKEKQTTTILILMDKPGRLCNNPGIGRFVVSLCFINGKFINAVFEESLTFSVHRLELVSATGFQK